jgi:hypothetical protein
MSLPFWNRHTEKQRRKTDKAESAPAKLRPGMRRLSLTDKDKTGKTAYLISGYRKTQNRGMRQTGFKEE